MARTEFELLSELEDELKEDEAIERELVFPTIPARGGSARPVRSRCPRDSFLIIRCYSPGGTSPFFLRDLNRYKLKKISSEIKRRLVSTEALAVQVEITGHADTKEGAASPEDTSYRRANNVQYGLNELLGPFSARVRWVVSAAGAAEPAVPGPRTEIERKCNRRVEVKLTSGSAALLGGPESVRSDEFGFLRELDAELEEEQVLEMPPIRLPDLVLDDFDFNRADLKQKHRDQIDRLKQQIVDSWKPASTRPVLGVLVVGHTDEVGSDDYNRELGMRRAENVLSRLTGLIARGDFDMYQRMDWSRESRGKKQRKPGVPANKNRRVEIFLQWGRVKPQPPRPRPPPGPDPRCVAECEALARRCLSQTRFPPGCLIDRANCIRRCPVSFAFQTLFR